MKIQLEDTPTYLADVNAMVDRMRAVGGTTDDMGADDAEWRVAFNAALGLTVDLARQGCLDPDCFVKVVVEYVKTIVAGRAGFEIEYLVGRSRQ